MSIASDVEWFLSLPPSPPSRLHTRGVWTAPREGKTDDGHGSEIGSPATSTAFRNRIETPFAHTVEVFEGRRCGHPSLDQRRIDELTRTGAPATDCGLCGGSGLYSGSDERYANPYAAAMARVWSLRPVHPNAPKPYTILFQLQVAEGDVVRMARFLERDFPCMFIKSHPFAHVGNALHLFRQRYAERESPRITPREKSESQLDAEASRSAA